MKIKKEHIVFFTFFMLILSNSRYLINERISSYFEYFSLGLLTLEILYCFYKHKGYKNKKLVVLFIISSILFNIGLIFQNLPIFSILRLICTMLSLSTIMLLSKYYLNSYQLLRAASYGMCFGIIANSILGLIGGINLLDPVHDEVSFIPLKYGFTGGMQFKNNLSSTVIACFMGISLYYKHIKKTKIDVITLLILLFLEIVSVSKGGLLIFGLVIILLMIDCKKKYFHFSLKKRSFGFKLLLASIVSCFIVVASLFVYNKFLAKSNTYAFRINGVKNYLQLVKDDHFHFYFGYAEMAFSNPNDSYVNNIRNYLASKGLTSYNGSYEMGFINTLIKNGMLGIISFALIYIWIVWEALKLKKAPNEKILIIGILAILLISSLVESYVCNIHQIFGIYCYLTMAGLLGVGSKKEGAQQ